MRVSSRLPHPRPGFMSYQGEQIWDRNIDVFFCKGSCRRKNTVSNLKFDRASWSSGPTSAAWAWSCTRQCGYRGTSRLPASRHSRRLPHLLRILFICLLRLVLRPFLFTFAREPKTFLLRPHFSKWVSHMVLECVSWSWVKKCPADIAMWIIWSADQMIVASAPVICPHATRWAHHCMITATSAAFPETARGVFNNFSYIKTQSPF